MTRTLFAALAAVFICLPASGKDWKIFCMPEKHLDVGWAYLPQDALDQGYPGSVEDFQNFATLRALFVRGGTASYPPEARWRWFFDAAWQIEQAQKYLPGLTNKIRELINAGEFGYNPIYANLHSMYLSHEQLMRMMAYSRVLERQGFRRSMVAAQGDVPTVGWGFASVLASAGVKYFLKGTWYDSPYSRNLAWIEPAPLFRWTGPDGAKVLVFYHDHYGVMSDGAAMGRALNEATVEKYVRKYEELSRSGKWPYDAIPMFGSEGDWGIPDGQTPAFIRDWNKSHPAVKILLATPEEFFTYIESHFADKIPDGVRGGWGISYDLVEANAAKPEARSRENDHLLLAAEAFGTLAALAAGTEYPAESLRQAWLKQVLFHEHSFGMRDGAGPEGLRQYAWKNRLTEQVSETARPALDSALAGLAAQIPNGGEERIAVFNSLSFPRSGAVEFRLGEGVGAARAVDIESDHEAPGVVVESGREKSLRFWAAAVPAFGYRSYRIERIASAGGTTDVRADAAARTLENRYYRLALAPDGSIASLYDKELTREAFRRDAPYRGNQFVGKDDAWRDYSPASATVTAEDRGAMGASLTASAAAVSIYYGVSTRYTLYADAKRLEIENNFSKQPGKSASNETVFYSFPFAVPEGSVWLDIPGVVARYPQDFRPETDWSIMPAQSFVAVSGARMHVVLATVESPNFEFGSMRKFFNHPASPDLSTTDIFAQPLTKQTVNKDDFDHAGGSYRFRYAVTSGVGALDPAAALRFAQSVQSGLEAVKLPNNRGPLAASGRLFDVQPAGVLASALKQADDGQGLIVRLWNPGDQPATAVLSLPGIGIASALRTDALERDTEILYDVRDGRVMVACGAREFVTARIRPARSTRR